MLRIDGHYPTDVDYPSSVVLALIYMADMKDPHALTFIRFFDTPKAAEVIARSLVLEDG